MDDSSNIKNSNPTNDLTIYQHVDHDDKVSEKDSDNTEVAL